MFIYVNYRCRKCNKNIAFKHYADTYLDPRWGLLGFPDCLSQITTVTKETHNCPASEKNENIFAELISVDNSPLDDDYEEIDRTSWDHPDIKKEEMKENGTES